MSTKSFPDQIIETDVVVVGGGGSGMAAAIAAAEQGARVILLEKNPFLGGTTKLSVGSITATGTRFQKAKGIYDTPDEHFEDMSLFLSPELATKENLELRRVLVDHVPETLEWLISIGLCFYGPMPANPYLLNAGGHLISAHTLQELAAKLGMPAEALTHTVTAYHHLLDGQTDHGQPPRSTAAYKAWPISQGPFHAIEVCAGITYTMGGIATDAQARVLHESGKPIGGLYAAGACTGGLEGGGEATGYSGGLSKSAVFGMLAGEAMDHFLRAA